MPPRNFNVILFSIVVGILCHFTYRDTRTASILGEAIELIDQNYVESVDRRELVIAAMQGVVSTLDQHSSYFAVDQYASFQDNMHQEFAGIGIYVVQPDPAEPVRVLTPIVNSPALRAGVLPNDSIVEVDGVDVSAMEIKEVSDRLKGPIGTKVRMLVRRGQETKSLTVQRDTIELESVVGDHRNADNEWVYRLESEPRIAYIRMTSFGEKTQQELEGILLDLDNDFDGLILDVRGNSGGLLYSAKDVCDMFLSEGGIVSTRARDGRLEEALFATPGTRVRMDKPIAVLIDGNSASASEILAACLQDNNRAIVVGTRSYGKGTVQEVMPLEYGRSALRLTVARYYRPNNKNIHRTEDATEEDEWGVTPDPGFLIPMDADQLARLQTRWNEASFPMLAGIEPLESNASIDNAAAPAVDGKAQEMIEDTEDSVKPDPESSEADLPAPPELSPAAKLNVSRGPESLDYDPPLRAAVGALLRN